MQVYCSIYVIYQIKNTKSAKFLTLHTTLKTGWMDGWMLFFTQVILYFTLNLIHTASSEQIHAPF